MSYCGSCGTQIHEGQNFCAGCGAALGRDTVAPQPSAAAPARPAPVDGAVARPGSEAVVQNLATLKAQSPPPAKSSGKKILIALLAIFLVGAIVAIAGVAYVGYRVKQKVSAALGNMEGQSDRHRATGQAAPTDSGQSTPDNNGDGSSDRDAGKPSDKSGGDPEDILKSLAQAGKSSGSHQNDGDDPNLAKGLDAIGGLMDKMGFGDPPPNPYQELPIVKSDSMYNNLCDPNNEAKHLSNSYVSAV